MKNAYVSDRYHYSETTLIYKAHLSHILMKSAQGFNVSILKHQSVLTSTCNTSYSISVSNTYAGDDWIPAF